MKKIYSTILLSLMMLALIGCTSNLTNDPDPDPDPNPNEDKYLNDEIPPILSFSDATKQSYSVLQSSDIDLFEGLRALDNLEGNITDKIQVDLGDFDIETPGTYELFFFVVDRAGNVSNMLTKVITVMPVYSILSAYPIFTGMIEGEAPIPEKPRIFQGAYYHRVFSSRDYWVGLEAEITLPMPNLKRYQGTFNPSLNMDPSARNLDNPSIYMGGNATYESDVGLSLKTVLVKNQSGAMAVSTGSYAFRPFWRYITPYDYDLGSYDRPNGRFYSVSSASAENQSVKNMIGNWDYLDTQYYYLPGDRLRMILYSVRPGYLQLQIEVIEKSTLQYSIDVRANNDWKDPEDFISPAFASPGNGSVKTEFKRVNAIDQVANEGRPVHPTLSSVGEMIWHNVYLHRNINGTMFRVPLNMLRGNYISAPLPEYFTASLIDEVTGGQRVQIHPNNG